MNKELILNDGVKGKLTSPKQEEGITLVALVITIIVLLILAGVSIATITGYDSIPDNAKTAVEASRQDATVEQTMVNSINNLFEKYLPSGGNNGGDGEVDTVAPTITANNASIEIEEKANNTFESLFTVTWGGTIEGTITYTINDENTSYTNTSELAVGTHTLKCIVTKDNGKSANASVSITVKGSGIASITTATEIQSGTTPYLDGTGKNTVMVPGGFKVRTDIATTVQQGIVIEDDIGNQFVWIPIGDVYKDDGTSTFVEFGRYDYWGIMQQSADDYEHIVEINNVYEMYTFRESNFSRTSPIPSTSYNLGEFITKTKENKGFYIARYTGRFVDDTGISSGFTEGSPAVTTQVPVFDGESSSVCRQGDAAIACRNLYKGNTFVSSDLINSYAGGTAAKCFNSCVEIGIFGNRSSKQWTTESITYRGIEDGILYSYLGYDWGGGQADRWFILLFF